MGIRDVNSLTGMILNKLNSSATQSTNSASTAVQDFKKIVAEGGFMSFAGVDTGDDVTAQPVEKEVKVADSSSKDKKTERPTEKADKKEDALSTKNEDKSPVDDKKTQPEEKVENKTDKETVEQDTKPEQSAEKTENAKEDTSAETVENADSVSAEGENIASEKPQQNKNIKEQVFVAEQMIPLENLSAMNAVTVYNAVDGTYSVMTGAELVAQIENYGTEIGAFMSQNGQSDITLVNLQQPQANQQVSLISDKGQVELVEGMEAVPEETFAAAVKEAQVQPEEKKKSDIQFAANQNNKNVKTAETAAEVVAPVAEQEEQISKLVGEDKKLDIKVDVKEENFAYDKARVNVKGEEKSENIKFDTASIKTTATSATEVKAQPATINNNLVQPLVAAEVQPQNAALNAANTSSLSAGIKGVSEGLTQSNTANLANLAGTETAAHNLKAEGSVQGDNKTTFRDVYKGMSREVAEQVKVNITKSAVKGVDSIEIKLKPEELGHIEVKMQISKDGKLQAHIISSRAETMDMLQKELPTLEKAFADAGFSLDNGSLSFSFRDNQAGNRENNELRQFLSNVFEQEAGNENNQMAELSGYDSWDGKSALNIRV